jgi:hypothetical protein
MRPTAKLLVLGLLLPLSAARAAETPPDKKPEQIESAGRWRQQAVQYAAGIADADVRGKAHYDLVYVLGFAGDLAGARASMPSIDNPQLRIYAHVFLAKQYKKTGDDDACRSELQEAGKVTLLPDNTSHTDVIRTYLELDQPAEAIALAAKIPNEFHRNAAFQTIAATLAKQGKLEMASDVVQQRLPASWRESGWSVMANACADELRIDEAQKLAARLTDQKLQDRAYDHLVKALLKADRAAEVGPFADRIAEETLRATAQAQIAAVSAKEQSAEVLQSRIEKAATREEKLALYDLLFAKLVEAGNVADAEAVIESMVKTIENSPRKPEISKFGVADDSGMIAKARLNYLATAKLLAARGDREASRLRVDRVRKTVTELPDETGLLKLILVPLFVKAEIDLGDFQGARTTLGQLKDGFSKSSMAAEIAAGLIESGDVKAGLEVAELITESLGKDSALGKVASALLRAGKLEEAKTLLQKVGDGRYEIGAFRTVGKILMELGRETELQQWLGELKSNAARAYLCMGANDALQKPRAEKTQSTQGG